MNALQQIVNADPEYPIANAVLREDLPRLDSCDPDELETFVSEIRWALTKKVGQVALTHAFREDLNGNDVSLRELCAEAGLKIRNPSFIASVQEFVLQEFDSTGKGELHPIPEVVERETALAYEKIIKALSPLLRA